MELVEEAKELLRETAKDLICAIVAEYQSGSIRGGDEVTVIGISELEDLYGTLVHVKHKREIYTVPLCDLKAPDMDTQTEQLVDDYAVWFANR